MRGKTMKNLHININSSEFRSHLSFQTIHTATVWMNLVFKSSISIFFTALVFLLIACIEKNTEDPKETYMLWSGEKPSKEVEIIHGKYWQSSHWSKEYIIYLELKGSPLWRNEFIKQNSLIQGKTDESLPSNAPSWFKPTAKFKIWKPSKFSQGAVYYENSQSGQMFIYEIQL